MKRISVLKAVWTDGSVSCHDDWIALDLFLDWFKAMKVQYTYRSTITKKDDPRPGWCCWLYRAKKKDQNKVGTGMPY